MSDVATKCFQSSRMFFVESAFTNYVSALPVVAAVEQHHELTHANEPERLRRIGVVSGQTKPEDIDRCAKINNLKAAAFSHPRAAPVRRHHKIGANLQW